MLSVSLLSFRGQCGASLQRIGDSRLSLDGSFVRNISGPGHVRAICEQPGGDSGPDRAFRRADALRRLLDLGVRSLGFPDCGTLFIARNAYVILQLACSCFGARSPVIGGGRHG